LQKLSLRRRAMSRGDIVDLVISKYAAARSDSRPFAA
jgi:hypothetical protein